MHHRQLYLRVEETTTRACCRLVIATLVVGAIDGCSSVFGPPARPSVVNDSPTGGYMPQRGEFRDPSNNYQPQDSGDYQDLRHH